jgi:hypothetical protein
VLPREAALSEHQALDEFHALLRQCAQGQVLSRDLPVRYQVCRTALITGRLRFHLPGFVRTCVSLYKFREFIFLYDPDATQRLRFVDRSLEDCWIQLNERPSHEEPDADDF